jgi:hypothetical protein
VRQCDSERQPEREAEREEAEAARGSLGGGWRLPAAAAPEIRSHSSGVYPASEGARMWPMPVPRQQQREREVGVVPQLAVRHSPWYGRDDVGSQPYEPRLHCAAAELRRRQIKGLETKVRGEQAAALAHSWTQQQDNGRSAAQNIGERTMVVHGTRMSPTQTQRGRRLSSRAQVAAVAATAHIRGELVVPDGELAWIAGGAATQVVDAGGGGGGAAAAALQMARRRLCFAALLSGRLAPWSWRQARFAGDLAEMVGRELWRSWGGSGLLCRAHSSIDITAEAGALAMGRIEGGSCCWGTALCGGAPMRAGRHYAEFTLLPAAAASSFPHVVLGVARADFDPEPASARAGEQGRGRGPLATMSLRSRGDGRGGGGGEGWGYATASGQAVHARRGDSSWAAPGGVKATVGDTIGLLLDLGGEGQKVARGSDSQSTPGGGGGGGSSGTRGDGGRLSLAKNGEHVGLLWAGLPVGATGPGLVWALELRSQGVSVRVAAGRAAPPLPPWAVASSQEAPTCSSSPAA